jgi:ABC-type nickel/cobalt efflux system permease component RcnA
MDNFDDKLTKCAEEEADTIMAAWVFGLMVVMILCAIAIVVLGIVLL